MGLPTAVLLRTQSDERLVALARDGHERAFETIVRRYRRPLLGACQRICADGRGEDVLQQALLSAWAGLRRGDDVRDLRAWLYRIVRNAAVSHRRRERSGGEPAGRDRWHDGLELVDTLSVAASPEEEAERRAVVQETLEAIAELPDRQREALLRIAVQGHSQDEVAGELGLSAVAVRQLVHRARTALRAAATAVVPFPAVSWAASLGAGDRGIAPRVAGLVAGAGGTGASATLLKAGAVAGVAATAVSAPLIAQHRPATPASAIGRPAIAQSSPRPAATPRPSAKVTPAAPQPTAAAPNPPAVAAPHHEAVARADRRAHGESAHGDARGGRSGGGGSTRRRSGGDGSNGDEERGSSHDGSAGGTPTPDGDGATVLTGDDGHDGHDGHDESHDDDGDGGDDGHRDAARTPTPAPTLAAATAVPTGTPTATDGDGDDGGGHDGHGGGGDD
jgi:RNA polymerase sigma factor (sigma-70 family)